MNTKPISAAQVRAIIVTLGVKGLADDREDIVSLFSDGRTSSVNSMYMHEARNLLMAYNKDRNENDKMIRKLFAMANEIGWIVERTQAEASGELTKIKDYSAVHNWVEKFGYLKKGLQQYIYNELPKLLSQFEIGPYTLYISKL